MNRFQYRLSFFAATAMFANIVLANNEAARSASEQRYVIGSWVNVRSMPAANAAVIDHVIVNTPVVVANDEAGNGFCEIAYAGGKRGHVTCRLIGDKPLSLQEVGLPHSANGEPNPSYSAPRAFWIEPSVDRLMVAGKYFETVMLKPEELMAEQKPPAEHGERAKVRRFPIPEYEAMKERLRNGVVGFLGANDRDIRLAKWQAIKDIAASNPAAGGLTSEGQSIRNLFRFWGHRDTPMDLIRALELPSIKQSYFRDAGKILPPFATTETASVVFGTPYRAVVKSGPKWIPAGHYSDGYLFGAWDVGAVETRLVSTVHKHTIFRDGKILSEASDVPGGRFPDTDADGGDCDIGFSWGDAGASILRATFGKIPPVKKPGESLFYYFSKDRLADSPASVVRSKTKFSYAGFIKAETFLIDVDRDGVGDILVWEGTGVSEQPIWDPGSAQANYRIIFFNVDGEWHLFLVDEFLYGCGC